MEVKEINLQLKNQGAVRKHFFLGNKSFASSESQTKKRNLKFNPP